MVGHIAEMPTVVSHSGSRWAVGLETTHSHTVSLPRRESPSAKAKLTDWSSAMASEAHSSVLPLKVVNDSKY